MALSFETMFERRDRWGNGWALWVLLAMVSALPWAWSALRQVRIENEVENWLPSHDPQTVVLRWYRQHFSTDDRVLISWDGSSLFDARVERFAQRLEGRPGPDGTRRGGVPYVDRVATPHEALANMLKRRVEPDDAIRRLEGVLLGSGPYQVRLTAAGRERIDRVRRMLAEEARVQLGVAVDLLPPGPEPESGSDAELAAAGDAPTDEAAAQEVPSSSEPADAETEVRVDLHDVLVDLWRPHDFQVAWKGMHADVERRDRFRELALGLRSHPTPDLPEGEPLIADCFLQPGTPAAITVVLSEAGNEDRGAAFEAIRAAAADVAIEPHTLRMGGRAVASHALNSAVKAAAWNRAAPLWELHRRSPLLLSALVSVVLAFFMLRSARLATLVLAVSFYTTLIAVAVVPATGGSMNMVLVVMPTLLMVLTVSAAIHLANYWKHAAHRDPATSIPQAVRTAKLPCTLAAVTTAIGLLSLTTSTLTPVRDFGLYAALGCGLSLLVVLVGLPALMQYWPGRQPDSAEVNCEVWRVLGAWLARHQRWVSAACLAVFAVGSLGLKDFRTETKVIRYFRDSSRVVQDYHELEDKLSGIIPVDTIVRFDAQAQREHNFFQRMEIVRRVEEKVRAHPEISGALSLADFQPVREPPQTKGRVPWLMYHKRASETERRMKEPGTAAAKFLVVARETSPSPRPGEAPLSQAGDELWRITAQAAIMSDVSYSELTGDLDEIVQSELKLIPGAGHIVTGMVPIFLRTQQAVLESLIRSFALAFAVIAVVMMLLLRHPTSGLAAMLPNLLPVGVVFGLISWYGIRVDIGTMITASVALGVAVDGTLHLLTWFQEAIAQGQSRAEAVAAALGKCGPALWQTSAAVGVGLAMLSFADLLLISRFGWLMAALIGAALASNIVLLPALLAGPLGRPIERMVRKRVAGSGSGNASAADPASPRPHRQPLLSSSQRVLRID